MVEPAPCACRQAALRVDEFGNGGRWRTYAQALRQPGRRGLEPRTAIRDAACAGNHMTENPGNSPEQVEQALDHIARVAAVMLDGDACQRIVTPRALEYMFKTDPH